MNDIVFVVEKAPTGGLIARALGTTLRAEAEDIDNLYDLVCDTVRNHFGDQRSPRLFDMRAFCAQQSR